MKRLRGWVVKYAKPLGALAVSILLVAAIVTVALLQDSEDGWWPPACAALGVLVISTLVPILWSFLSFGELFDPGDWFDTASQLGRHQARVVAHYSRIKGTLRFWKNKAAAHQRLHLARVLWSLLSAVSLPVLIQRYDPQNQWSVLFMTTLTTWTGLVVALAYTFKSEEKYQGLRRQESDFYDASRDLMDSVIDENDPELEPKVDQYIDLIKAIRRTGRRVETGSPPSAI